MDELHRCLWSGGVLKIYTSAISAKGNARLLVLDNAKQEAEIKSSLRGHFGEPLFLEWPDVLQPAHFNILDEYIADLGSPSVFLNLSSGGRSSAMRILQWALDKDISAYLVDPGDSLHWLNLSDLSVSQLYHQTALEALASVTLKSLRKMNCLDSAAI